MTLLVYGLMRARDCPRGMSVRSRGKPLEVRAVRHDGICALVGETRDDSVRVRRETLLAHNAVVQTAMDHGPVLPFRFGVALEDEEAVRHELLEPNVSNLTARLDALDGSVELQVKATFEHERLLASVLAADRGLAALAARVRALPGDAGHFDRVQLGEAIAHAIEARADAAATEITRRLEPLTRAVSLGARQHEWMALNAAFLVDQQQREAFDKAVDGLALEYAGELRFRVLGPLPPHSFADYEWEQGWA